MITLSAHTPIIKLRGVYVFIDSRNNEYSIYDPYEDIEYTQILNILLRPNGIQADVIHNKENLLIISPLILEEINNRIKLSPTS